MTDKDVFLEWWGFKAGTPEAEEAWRAKRQMHERPSRAPLCFVQKDIHYTSPIDGRPITNKQDRIEDLKRNNCIEYDPEMKKDAARRMTEQETTLERNVDETVEREISLMPSIKKERLQAEVEGGLTTEIERRTYGN